MIKIVQEKSLVVDLKPSIKRSCQYRIRWQIPKILTR